ncbi:hypothetical protein Nocox_21685 [Nonomuraea coxensis DSM 45129]|uniref:Uncharacterized protein n=1 Tax=Nonomuraea coxensis DSM 45129 TaxID=1122611 RepID=A0ABX8U4W8_9ACTN|nr:hypothetical protein [Nonomuraea coxensis]QYC41941.1 hypothetical protein Nocox_21685 [Nonomuraea coxensis DSM 45129]
MGTESVLCPVCQGVLPASGKEAYTTLRGRLILTNGYCGGDCAERVAQERTREMARPRPAMPVMPAEPAQAPVPMAEAAPVMPPVMTARPAGGASLRVVR